MLIRHALVLKGTAATPAGLLPASQQTTSAPTVTTLPERSPSSSLVSALSDRSTDSSISCSPSL